MCALGQPLQVYIRYRNAYGLPNDLERLAGNISKCCAQDFVTPDNFLEALHQGLYLKGAVQTYSFQQVVGMLTEPQLFKEPQSLLGIRQWEGAIPWYGLQR